MNWFSKEEYEGYLADCPTLCNKMGREMGVSYFDAMESKTVVEKFDKKQKNGKSLNEMFSIQY